MVVGENRQGGAPLACFVDGGGGFSAAPILPFLLLSVSSLPQKYSIPQNSTRLLHFGIVDFEEGSFHGGCFTRGKERGVPWI